MTLFERCVEAVEACRDLARDEGNARLLAAGFWPDDSREPTASIAITRAVLQTLLDGTGSLRTQEEVARILAEAGE